MRYFEDEISGIDGSTATFVGYCLDNSSEIDPNRKRPSVLVIPGGGYEMTSDREAEPIAMQFLAAGFNAFVLRYSVKPSIFPVALLEAAEAMRRIRTHADEWHCDADAIAAIGFSAGGHLAANLATSASDDVLAAHGYDADAVRPNGLMLAYPVVTSGPLAHRGSFDALLGDRKADPEALDAVSIEKHIDAKTPPVFVWHTVPDDCVPYENTLMLVDACKKAGVSVEAHLFPSGGHGLSLGTAETAWQGVNGIEPCAGLAETCDRVDASYICGYRRCHDRLCHSRRDCRIIAIPAFFSASFHVFFVARLRFSDQKTSRATFNRVKYPLTGIFRAKTALRGYSASHDLKITAKNQSRATFCAT